MSFPPSVPESVAALSVPVPLASPSAAVPTHVLPPQPKGEIVHTDERSVPPPFVVSAPFRLELTAPLFHCLSYRQFTLMIDNYDSFTHNLYQFLEQMGAHVRVVRNDQITLEEIKVSPGNH